MASTSSTVMVIEPVVDTRQKMGKRNILSELPPLPLEEDLFTQHHSRKESRRVDMQVHVFMDMMPREEKYLVEVDKMSRVLDITKDKMREILNVLEGLRLVEREVITVYRWQGRMVLLPALMMLKQMAEKEDMMGQLSLARGLLTQSSEGKNQKGKAWKIPEAKYNLVMMTQKVMMMFLTLPSPRILSLAEASIIIHGSFLTDVKRKASIQRLNSISKVMVGVGLLAIMNQEEYIKDMSYQYVGPEVPQSPALNIVYEEVEVVEEEAVVRDMSEDEREDEAIPVGAVRLKKIVS